MNTNQRNIRSFIIFTIFIFLFSVSFLISTRTKNVELSYKEFISVLDNKDVSHVKIVRNLTTNTTKAFIVNKNFETSEYVYNVFDIESFNKSLNNKNIDYISEIKEELPFFRYWLPLALLVQGIVLIVIFFSFFKASKDGSKFAPTKGNIQTILNTKVKFTDVAGLKEEKQEVEEIVDFLKNKEKYSLLGARIPKGVLLVGPPGTGKTLLAKAIAGEAEVPFFSLSGSDFVEMFVGVGASRVRELFKLAKRNSPCIIFIDEIDAVARKRGSGLGGSHDEREQTLNQLLVEMDGFNENEGIIVLAATNRSDILDPAILRPGRFDRKISVVKPDRLAREEILNVHIKNKPIAEDVDLKDLARNTQGLTGADLENLLNEAAILSARKDKKFITDADIQEAFIKNFIGTEKKSRVIPEEERIKTAYHEVGHAILFRELPHVGPVHIISIIPSTNGAAGYTMPKLKDDHLFETKESLINMIKVSLGGRIAEEIVFSDVTTGAVQDILDITKKARAMVTMFGMSDKLGMVNYTSSDELLINGDFVAQKEYSEASAKLIDEEVKAIIDKAYTEAKEIILKRRDVMEKAVKLLLEKEKIGFEEFEALFE